MKSKLQNKLNRESGFTIIEVLIVLAIAGLILLVVFLAVPALQRNSRNTAIKSDVQNLLGGISEYQANNNGRMPTNVSGTGAITISQGTQAAPTAPTQTTNIQGSTTVTSGTGAPGTGVPATGAIYIRIGARCDGTASTRAVAASYNLETSGGNTVTCQDS